MRAFCSGYTFHFNALRNYLRKLERRPKWQHIRFTYDILSFLWSVQPLRVTPAYTGKRPTPRWVRPNPRDHPRACGEKLVSVSGSSSVPGSPPRMRGKERLDVFNLCAKRITPAHAGKSSLAVGMAALSWDHPRACGEKPADEGWLARQKGSPPRMRGKALANDMGHTMTGITPAYAGKRHDYC